MSLNLLFLILVLIAIIYQDFMDRAVSWYFFLLLPISIIFLGFSDVRTMLINTAFNLVFILLNAMLIIGYFSIKNKSIINPLNKYIGAGDLLFYIGLAFLFSPLNYIVFFIFGLLITLLFYFIVFLIKRDRLQKIPLAGFVSILLLLTILIGSFLKWEFANDIWMLKNVFLNG